jgi:hypothetical protein
LTIYNKRIILDLDFNFEIENGKDINVIKLEVGVATLLMRKTLSPIRERIINQIQSYDGEVVFFYDFSGIDGINTSGIDEIIAKVMNYLINYEDNKFLILINLKEEDFEHEFNIDYSLSRLDVGVIAKKPNGNPAFLGKISDTHKELLEIVYRASEMTARELADKTGKKLSLISTHLNKLHTLKLLRRKEELLVDGGRQFIYKSLF